MNNLRPNIKNLCYLVFSLFTVSYVNLLLAQAEYENTLPHQNISQSEFLKQIEINHGKGTFEQNKYFKFLSQPIISKGTFILSDQTALWETQSPIFSQLLLTPETIYTRFDITKNYQTLVKDSTFSQLLSTLLSGRFKDHDWQEITMTNSNCINLIPATNALKKVFKQVQVCLINKLTRQINLLDNNNNKTSITMILTNLNISESDVTQLSPKSSKIVTP